MSKADDARYCERTFPLLLTFARTLLNERSNDWTGMDDVASDVASGMLTWLCFGITLAQYEPELAAQLRVSSLARASVERDIPLERCESASLECLHGLTTALRD